MKINYDGYEIEIKAKRTNKARANKEDTNSIMNLLSIYAHMASERFNETGCPGLSAWAEKLSEEIHKTLEENKYYN